MRQSIATLPTRLLPVIAASACMFAMLLCPALAHADKIFVTVSPGVVTVSAAGWPSFFGTVDHVPKGIAVDPSGNVFASDYASGYIYKFTPDGVRSTFGDAGYHSYPESLALDGLGNLYAACSKKSHSFGNVSKFSPSGHRSTFANWLDYPDAVACDSANNVYVSVSGAILKITPDGSQSVFANVGAAGLAFDWAGNLYTSGGNTIRRITPDGTSSVWSVSPTLDRGKGMAFDSAGYLYVADWGNYGLEKFSPTGQALGPFAPRRLSHPQSVAIFTPEPGTLTLLALGALGILGRLRRDFRVRGVRHRGVRGT